MTQAELAATDFTKGFISLLETGHTRVSLRAAEIIARRLGVSAAELIGDADSDLELALLRGEQQLSAGRALESITLVEPVAAAASGTLRARALRARGRALVEIGRPREGLTDLQEAGRLFEIGMESESHVRTLYDRALAYAHLNEPGNALTYALECDAAMRAGGLVDRTLELQLRSLLATAFARAGDLASADLQAERALQLAEDVVDREALASLYSTISLSRQRQNDLDGAVAYARKSLGLYEELGRERSIGQTWQNLAAMYIDRSEYPRAIQALERAEHIATEGKIPSLEARTITTRAELAAAQKRWPEALRLGRMGAEHPGASSYTRSRGLFVQARALAARKASPAQLRAVFDEAIAALRDEPGRIRAEAHEAYGEILATRADWRAAYEQARQALDLSRPELRRRGR